MSNVTKRRDRARRRGRGGPLVALGVALTVVVGGCGGGQSAGPAPTEPPTSAPTTTPTTVPELVSPVATVEDIVSSLQLDLQSLGYKPGVTGQFNAQSHQALLAFQKELGVDAAEHGALGPLTAKALQARVPNESGTVDALQSALTDVGFFQATINGRYDADTSAAVKSLQQHSGISGDGLFGQRSAQALSDLYLEKVPEPPVPQTTTTVPAPDTTTPATTLPEAGPQLLKLGSTGAAVTQLQQRLTALGYRPGAPDGTYGNNTASAVLAFQKREGGQRDGVAGPSVQAALADPTGAGPRSGLPTPRIEVDIARQIAFVVLASQPLITLNVSTGNGETYQVPGGGTDVAYTPVGSFTVLRKITGDEHAPLGTLRNPLYFYQGWAVHGAASVPAYPASHGCVRISNADVDWLFPLIAVGTPVVLYDTTGKSPGPDQAPPGAAPGY